MRSFNDSYRSADYRPAVTSSMIMWILLQALMVLLLSPITASAQETPDKDTPVIRREVFLPMDQLSVLIGGDHQNVLLDRDEYETLRKAAAAVELAAKDQPQLSDTTTGIIRADYDIRLEKGRARIDSRMAIDVMRDGLHRITLPVQGVSLRAAFVSTDAPGSPAHDQMLQRLDTAQADDSAAMVGMENNRHHVFLNGNPDGLRHYLVARWAVPVATDRAVQSLSVRLPSVGAGTLRLSVDGDVELKSGAVVISRRVAKDENRTYFELLPSPQTFNLVLSMNNKRKRTRQSAIGNMWI
ncbi:MAG: hypothetical protein AAFN70_16255, partial [Planctomycetota bacterium]